MRDARGDRRGRRPHRPDPDAGPAEAFAHQLWQLKLAAGDPSYAEMCDHLGAAASKSSLAAAAQGKSLPSWAVTWEFVRVLAVGRLGGDPAETEREWQARWRKAFAAITLSFPETQTPGGAARSAASSPEGGTPGTWPSAPTQPPLNAEASTGSASPSPETATLGGAAMVPDSTSLVPEAVVAGSTVADPDPAGRMTPPSPGAGASARSALPLTSGAPSAPRVSDGIAPSFSSFAPSPEVAASSPPVSEVPGGAGHPARDAKVPAETGLGRLTVGGAGAVPDVFAAPLPEGNVPVRGTPDAGVLTGVAVPSLEAEVRVVPAARRVRRRVLAVAVVAVAVAVAGVFLFSGRPPERSVPTPIPLDESVFEGDITVPDGTLVAKGETFEKVWRIKNVGKVEWDGRFLMRVNDTVCTAPRKVGIPYTPPGQSVDIRVPVQAPETVGECKIFWKMVDAEGRLLFPDKRPIFLDVRVG